MIVLSLILPIKNEESNLIHLCQSTSVQAFKDCFEVVIVDDSDLNHAKYVDSCIDILSRSEVRVKYLRGSGDGVGSAMFRGLSASGGRYVYFLDADNIFRKDFIAKVISWLKEDVAISFLSGGVILKRITGRRQGRERRSGSCRASPAASRPWRRPTSCTSSRRSTTPSAISALGGTNLPSA